MPKLVDEAEDFLEFTPRDFPQTIPSGGDSSRQHASVAEGCCSFTSGPQQTLSARSTHSRGQRGVPGGSPLLRHLQPRSKIISKWCAGAFSSCPVVGDHRVPQERRWSRNLGQRGKEATQSKSLEDHVNQVESEKEPKPKSPTAPHKKAFLVSWSLGRATPRATSTTEEMLGTHSAICPPCSESVPQVQRSRKAEAWIRHWRCHGAF